MGELAVTVRLHGQIVEDQVIPVGRSVRIGEAWGARVSFPGADLSVVRVDDGLLVRGRCLREGEEMQLALGPIEVGLAHTLPSSTPREWRGSFDLRFLLSALLVAAVGIWLDAAQDWIDRQAHGHGSPTLMVAVDRVLGDVPPRAISDQPSAISPAGPAGPADR